MCLDEMDKYINQIAFSSAEEFLKKYTGKEESSNIIGHFGLGFYSSFMVSDKVEVKSLSWQKDAKPVYWTCEGNTDFEMGEGDKKERGTEVILHINKESEEFLSPFRIREMLDKYCKFLPVEIEFENKIINTTKPAWTKTPLDLKEEDYLELHKQLYPMAEKPLFWIHLNVDYPFRLTGILYFPHIKPELEIQRNKIQLYCNQVFVTDSVQDVVPDFLMLLQGVIDSPDIPLNVSRSFLQNDPQVKKINSHITKKVAEKLEEMFKKERKDFENKWDDISVFVRFGMVSNDKFREKAMEFSLVKNIDKQFFTFPEYREKIKLLQTDKNKTLTILYCTDPETQDVYIKQVKKREYDVLVFNNLLDSHFINFMEGKEEKLRFQRVDADSVDKLIDKGTESIRLLSEPEEKNLLELVKECLTKEKGPLAQEKEPEINISPAGSQDPAVSIIFPEFMRRFQDMSMLSGMKKNGNLPEAFSVTINSNNPVFSKILKMLDPEKKKKSILHLYDLALLAQNRLKGDRLSQFIQDAEGRV